MLIFLLLFGFFPVVQAQNQAPSTQIAPLGGTNNGMTIQSSVTAAGANAASDSPIDLILSEEMISNLRDPFQMPTIILTKKEKPKTDLELFELKDFKLNGVITGPKKVRAMVSVPNGKTYFVSVGDAIGAREGRVTAIQADAIKVVEYDTDEKGRRVPEVFEVRINGEIESLSKKEM